MDSHRVTTEEPPDLGSCLSCTGFNLRKAARAVGQMYDDKLRPAGIRATQFSMLVAVSMAQPVTVNELARHTVIDRTTLTRNMEVLVKQGLIRVEPGADRRTRIVTITAEGRAVLLRAFPLWQDAQACLREKLSGERLNVLLVGLSELVSALHPP